MKEAKFHRGAPPIAEQQPETLLARMVNEYVYCPRLSWLEYVEREFDESYDTVDGERVHRRVDTARGELPADVLDMKAEATSVELSSRQLGMVARTDIVLGERGGRVVPVDFKRGFPRVETRGPIEA